MDETPPPSIMDPAEARKRFFLYFGIRLLGLAALLIGVFLLSKGTTILAVLSVLAGCASLFLRPRNLGLTRPPER